MSLLLFWMTPSSDRYATVTVALTAADSPIARPWTPLHVKPVSDVAKTGTWTNESSGTTDLFASIDDDPASDADWIASPTGSL